jgi:hypothetical protein
MDKKEEYLALLLSYHQLKERIKGARHYGEEHGLPSGSSITSNIKPSVRQLKQRNDRLTNDDEIVANDFAIKKILLEREALKNDLNVALDGLVKRIIESKYLEGVSKIEKTRFEYKLKNFAV